MGKLYLLGSFQLRFDSNFITFGQPRLEELIALLATQAGASIPRVEIAYRLWPDSAESQARTNVRGLLYKLKQAWPNMNDAIAVDRTHIAWREDTNIEVDVLQFDALLADADRQQEPALRVAMLAQAADLYCGDFLPTCFADWALAERERLRGEFTALLNLLIDGLSEQRDYEEALRRAKALQRLDPLQESAYRKLMQTYMALGDRAAALRVYHTCASTLRDELGVEPSPETEALRAQLLHLEEHAAASDAPQAVQRQQLVGRHQEWRQLQHAWREVQQRKAKCVLLFGEAGIGKTRLAEELIDWVERQGLISASSRLYAMEGALTYAPITEWLRSPRIRAALESIDDLWRVELARLIPDLLVDRPDLPRPDPMTESWQQQRFFQSIAYALQAAPAPILLHLDDMHWSDAETLTLLQYLLHGARNYPLLLIGGIRTEDAGGNKALAAFVEAIRHAGLLVELRLGPLSAQETAELAAQTLGEDVGPGAAEALHATSEGHPLYLIEEVRSRLTAPQQSPGSGREVRSQSYSVAEMPSRIYDLLEVRLDQLSQAGQQVVSVAAVIGRAFDYEILQASVPLDEMTLIDALDELWRRRIIREQAGDSYDFSHDRIREVAYHRISRARRKLYHRQVAQAMEAIRGGDVDDVAGELATHYAHAGDSAMAYHYYRQAVNVAVDQHALQHAGEMLDGALHHAPDEPATRINLLQSQDRLFKRLLQLERWAENLAEEEALLEALPASERSLRIAYELSRSQYLTEMNEGEAAVTAAQQALLLAEETESNDVLVRCCHVLGNAFQRQARMSEAGHAYRQMTRHARQADDPMLECRAMNAQTEAGFFSGMPTDELFDLLTSALAIAEEQDQKEQMSILHVKLGLLRTATAMGDFEQAEQNLHRARQLGEEIGDPARISIALNHLGLFYTSCGDYRRAEEALRACQAVEREQRVYWRNWETLHYLGALRMQIGHLDSARAKLVRACEQLDRIGIRHYEVRVRCDLGLVHHLADEQAQARNELSRALTLLDGYGVLRFEALALTRFGYVLEAMNHLTEAGECYERGCELHHQMGQHYLAMNAQAGLARIAALRDNNEAALDRAVTIWETIAGKETVATIETARTLRTCYTIFEAHDDPRAMDILTMARDQLQHRVSTIDNHDHIEQFWQLDDHRFFHEMV